MKASKYRKLKLLILILIAVFILWNAVWYMNYSTYAKFTSGYLKSPVNYAKDEEIYVEKLLDEHRSSLLEMYTLAKDEWHL